MRNLKALYADPNIFYQRLSFEDKSSYFIAQKKKKMKFMNYHILFVTRYNDF